MTGTAHSAIFGLAPTYGQQIGLDIEQVSLMMAGNFAGGMLLQWPIGWLSDRFDRRTVLTGTAALGAVAALGVLAAGSHPLAVVGAVSLLGGASLPLYSLCIAHTNDLVDAADVSAAQFADVTQSVATGQNFDERTKVLDAADDAVIDLADLNRCRASFDLLHRFGG